MNWYLIKIKYGLFLLWFSCDNSIFSINNAETKKMKKNYIGIFGSIFIIGFAYMSGEQIGEAIYSLSHPVASWTVLFAKSTQAINL